MVSLTEATVTWLRRGAWVVAAFAVAFNLVGRRVGLLEFRPGGSSFDTAVRPIFFGIFILGPQEQYV